MLRYLTTAFILLPANVLAAEFDRPIPQAQSATAEFWFALAAAALVAGLALVHYTVRRRP
ncbi:hypothetical protein [Notoacmeibacter ruber]|uniref:Protein NnrT n=1 Tax=Notoacmeibacter ruber TaxID=2670375 RepID=A0A3L7JJD2_9HYPH|nr:hypothetical protein [Notoacmeibacter ruber]RLQ88592.1 hypothetical protein D8780_10615 [Notoacmeibacter ruber]